MTETIPSQADESQPADLSIRLLEDPAGVDPDRIHACLQASGSGPSSEIDEVELILILATLYARPELVGEEAVVVVTVILSRPALSDAAVGLACQVVGLLACFRVPTAADSLLALLRRTDLSPAAYDGLVRALADAAPWVAGDFDLTAVVDVVAQPHLSARRDMVLKRVVEPRLFLAPGEPRRRALNRLIEACGDSQDLAACLSYLRRHGWQDPDARETPTARAVEHLKKRVRVRLGTGRRHTLIVQNIADGQGDELIRVVPLAQALLDFNADLEVTLVTARPYLYAHPRIRLIALDDRAGVRAALRQAFDVVVEFFEPNVLTCNHDVGLPLAIAAHLQEKKPFIDLGSYKGYNQFVYSRVDVDGCSYLESLALDRSRVPNVYETTFRLIAGMGLPLRLGEELPASEPVIAGLQSPEAEAAWKDLTRDNVAGRPVALMNPFGGGEPLKGHVESTFDELVERVRETVSEGFFVVLLPNGTAWGSRDLALKIVGMLGPEEHRMVSVGADPATQPGPATLGSSHAIAVPGPAYAMHLISHFVRFADRVVAVEGWMIHAAYLLGKPFRVLMLPYSHGAEWHPYGRTANQSLMGPVGVSATRSAGLTAPPLPSQPRKFVLLALLGALAGVCDPRVPGIVRWALGSEDHDVRRMAACTLRRQSDPAVSDDLHRLLDDPSATVRSEAAAGLLERIGDEPIVANISRDQLLAYRWIGEEPRRWEKVVSLGDAARTALMRSLHDDDEVVRRESAQALFFLDRHSKPSVQPPATPRQSALRALFRRER